MPAWMVDPLPERYGVRDRSSVLDLLPETALQNGLVLPRMTFLPVANLSDVNRIGQQLVHRAPRKTPPARLNSFSATRGPSKRPRGSPLRPSAAGGSPTPESACWSVSQW